MPEKEDQPQQPDDRAASAAQPQGFDPSVLIAPGVAAVKHVWDMRKDVKAAAAPDFALSLAVLDSFARDQDHVIRTQLRNTTDCGIYLDSMTVTPPVDQRLAQSILEAGERTPKVYVPASSLRDDKAVQFPYLVWAQGTAELNIQFGLFNQQNHRSHPYALLKVEYSKLNETGPSEISFVIRVRWQGK